jgi:hypothetical protein
MIHHRFRSFTGYQAEPETLLNGLGQEALRQIFDARSEAFAFRPLVVDLKNPLFRFSVVHIPKRLDDLELQRPEERSRDETRRTLFRVTISNRMHPAAHQSVAGPGFSPSG